MTSRTLADADRELAALREQGELQESYVRALRDTNERLLRIVHRAIADLEGLWPITDFTVRLNRDAIVDRLRAALAPTEVDEKGDR